MDARIKQLNSRIDRLEAEFERNRQQLHHLAEENRTTIRCWSATYASTTRSTAC